MSVEGHSGSGPVVHELIRRGGRTGLGDGDRDDDGDAERTDISPLEDEEAGRRIQRSHDTCAPYGIPSPRSFKMRRTQHKTYTVF